MRIIPLCGVNKTSSREISQKKFINVHKSLQHNRWRPGGPQIASEFSLGTPRTKSAAWQQPRAGGGKMREIFQRASLSSVAAGVNNGKRK
jgi:hypothetical protein